MKIRPIVILSLAVLFAAIVVWVSYRNSTRSYSDYRRTMPVPMQVDLRIKGDLSYYAVVSHEDPSSSHSGPPIHVFDTDGKLIDQTSDSGDDPAFRKRWQNTFVRGVTIEETDNILLGR